MLDHCRDFRREAVMEIHESLVNGQRQQMVELIDLYGVGDFWVDYDQFLGETSESLSEMMMWFTDAVIFYHKIKNR